MLLFKNTFTDAGYRKDVFLKKIANNEKYRKTYCYGNHTKFANNCTRWFL